MRACPAATRPAVARSFTILVKRLPKLQSRVATCVIPNSYDAHLPAFGAYGARKRRPMNRANGLPNKALTHRQAISPNR